MLAPGTAPRETVEGGRVDRAPRAPPAPRASWWLVPVPDAGPPGRERRDASTCQGARGSRLAAIRLRC